MTVEIKLAYDEAEEIIELFEEYSQMLLENDADFKKYLEIQHYDEELKDLNLKYGLPTGRLYIAKVDGKTAGCIGLKKIDGQRCELKRLYVREQYRGNKIASRLVKTVIGDARDIGYSVMLLDTLPFLTSAIALYKKEGFEETEAYNESPMSNSVYMKLELDKR